MCAASPGPPARTANPHRASDTIPKLVAAIVADGGIDATRAERITRAVVGALRDLVQDEVRDVAAVLSVELRELWENEPNLEPKAAHDTATS